MQNRRLLLVVLSLFVVLGAASPVLAAPSWKDRTEAQRLFNEGLKHEKTESWSEARESFEAAVALHDTAKARFRLARALFNLGLLIEAREHAQQVADNKQAGWWDRKHSKDLLKQIEEKLPHLTVKVPDGFEGTVHLDDKQLGSDSLGTRMEANPGTVVIRAEAHGYLPFEQNVVLSDGADESITIKMEIEPADEPTNEEKVEVSTSDGSTRKTLGYISLAVGGVGLIAGTAYGLAARSTRSDLDAACVDDVCSENQRDTYDKGKTQANFATAGFLVGGIGLSLGAVLLLTGSDDEPEAGAAKVEPYVGPTSAGVHGRF